MPLSPAHAPISWYKHPTTQKVSSCSRGYETFLFLHEHFILRESVAQNSWLAPLTAVHRMCSWRHCWESWSQSHREPSVSLYGLLRAQKLCNVLPRFQLCFGGTFVKMAISNSLCKLILSGAVEVK